MSLNDQYISVLIFNKNLLLFAFLMACGNYEFSSQFKSQASASPFFFFPTDTRDAIFKFSLTTRRKQKVENENNKKRNMDETRTENWTSQ